MGCSSSRGEAVPQDVPPYSTRAAAAARMGHAATKQRQDAAYGMSPLDPEHQVHKARRSGNSATGGRVVLIDPRQQQHRSGTSTPGGTQGRGYVGSGQHPASSLDNADASSSSVEPDIDVAGTFSRRYTRKENASMRPHSAKFVHVHVHDTKRHSKRVAISAHASVRGAGGGALSTQSRGGGSGSAGQRSVMARSIRMLSRVFNLGLASNKWILRSTSPIKHDYQFLGVVGRGQFGQVYAVRPHVQPGYSGTSSSMNASFSGVRYACKTLQKHKLLEQLEPDDIRKEIEVQHHLSGHSLVVGLRRCYEDERHVHCVMELCHGDLYELLRERKYLSEAEAAPLMRQALRAVQYCHSMGVVHRDIKPENFLLAAAGDLTLVRLTDFGLSTFHVEGQALTELLGSPYYIAPEVIRQSYGPEADVWSAGVMLYILLCGEAPFHGEGDEGIFRAILKARLDFSFAPWSALSWEVKDLLRRMLTKDVRQRASLQEALSHAWFERFAAVPEQPSLQVIGGGDGSGWEDTSTWARSDPHIATHMTTEGSPEPVLYVRLMRHAQRSLVGKAVAAALVTALPPEMTYGVANLFTDFDLGNDGFVDAAELQDGLSRRAGINLSDSEAACLLAAADLDGDGRLSCMEWAAATVLISGPERAAYLSTVWQRMDPDGDGLADPLQASEALRLPGMVMAAAAASASAAADSGDCYAGAHGGADPQGRQLGSGRGGGRHSQAPPAGLKRSEQHGSMSVVQARMHAAALLCGEAGPAGKDGKLTSHTFMAAFMQDRPAPAAAAATTADAIWAAAAGMKFAGSCLEGTGGAAPSHRLMAAAGQVAAAWGQTLGGADQGRAGSKPHADSACDVQALELSCPGMVMTAGGGGYGRQAEGGMGSYAMGLSGGASVVGAEAGTTVHQQLWLEAADPSRTHLPGSVASMHSITSQA